MSLEIANVYTRQHNAAEQGKLREERVILSTLDRQNQSILIWPQTRILVAAAGLLGAVVAGLVALSVAYLDDSIRSAADVQQFLELPVLGSIPRLQSASAGGIGPFARWSRSHEEHPAEANAPSTAVRL